MTKIKTIGFVMFVLVGTWILLSCSGRVVPSSKAGERVRHPALVPPVAGPMVYLSPSDEPPHGLSAKSVPMFVSIGFDDNAISGLPGSDTTGGMRWALDWLRNKQNANGTKARVSFYVNSSSLPSAENDNAEYVKAAWRQAVLDGHEIGNHTHNHKHGAKFSPQQWAAEMAQCTSWLIKPFGVLSDAGSIDDENGIGLDKENLFGFRTPFLEYNDAALTAVQQQGMIYDCSIEEGYQEHQDGRNFLWPYTLDNGSPGHDVQVGWGTKEPLTSHPGLWEMPVHVVIAPPDAVCEHYGIAKGFRNKLKAINDYFDPSDGKITGFDYNLWVLFKMSKAEFLATLKYTFDLRMAGNRAPMLFGGHSDIYAKQYGETIESSTYKERQEALEQFIEYVLSKKEVRVVPAIDVLNWIRNPA